MSAVRDLKDRWTNTPSYISIFEPLPSKVRTYHDNRRSGSRITYTIYVHHGPLRNPTNLHGRRKPLLLGIHDVDGPISTSEAYNKRPI